MKSKTKKNLVRRRERTSGKAQTKNSNTTIKNRVKYNSKKIKKQKKTKKLIGIMKGGGWRRQN